MHIMFVWVNEAHSSIASNTHQSVHLVSNMRQPKWHDIVSCRQAGLRWCVANMETAAMQNAASYTSQRCMT